MSTSVRRILFIIWILRTLNVGAASKKNRIWFPDEHFAHLLANSPEGLTEGKPQLSEELTEGSSCTTNDGSGRPTSGICAIFAACPDLVVSDAKVDYCSLNERKPLVCCPQQNLVTLIKEVSHEIPHEVPQRVSAPLLYYDPLRLWCGSEPTNEEYIGHAFGKTWGIYIMNETAELYRSRGFEVTVIEMYGDAISNFTVTNGLVTHKGQFDKIVRKPAFQFVRGGQPAKIHLSYFMALVGERHGNETEWLCDGVLINAGWIISAAHCFITSVTPNVVRLGDYNWQEQNEFEGVHKPYDSNIAQVVYHPKFNPSNRYHDIALVQMEKPYPVFSKHINPVCLPWAQFTGVDLVGKNVTLTGWGALSYDAANEGKTPVLQEVKLEVFDVGVCEKSYSNLIDYRTKWPEGMTSDRILCSGWRDGGRDACKGDSGGPLTYIGSESYPPYYVLAGIVSTGFGCGLKEFPGIYIPVNSPEYLQWIKDTAFQGYFDSADNPNYEWLIGSRNRFDHWRVNSTINSTINH